MRKLAVLTLGLWFAVMLFILPTASAVAPKYRMIDGGLVLEGVSADCPMIYDNDWWTDVPDAAYIWAKASMGKCSLRGNIITRCTFAWDQGYAHTMQQQVDEARRLYGWAKANSLRHVPEPILGATEVLRRPASGKIEDTQVVRSAGSDLIVAEARKASPQKPLLIFCGGSCTTVATACLTDASITDRMIVFQIDGGGYNSSDGWAWKIAMDRCIFANWASVRAGLYMATLAAMRFNAVIRPFGERLIAGGKAFKVTMIACMRKLVTILNVMVRNNEPWRAPVLQNA